MQLHNPTLQRSGHHPLAQAFEAVHLGLHQASAVVAAPLLPEPAPNPWQARCASLRTAALTHLSFQGFAFLREGITACAPLWAIAAWQPLVS